MALSDIVDQFLNQYGLANSGTTKQSNFTTFCVRLNQIDDLDARQQHFCVG